MPRAVHVSISHSIHNATLRRLLAVTNEHYFPQALTGKWFHFRNRKKPSRKPLASPLVQLPEWRKHASRQARSSPRAAVFNLKMAAERNISTGYKSDLAPIACACLRKHRWSRTSGSGKHLRRNFPLYRKVLAQITRSILWPGHLRVKDARQTPHAVRHSETRLIG